jgi:tape measure domain-containing protein
MATKIGDLFFDVYADVSRATKSIDDLSGKFARAGGEAARAIGETIANAVGIAVVATSALIGVTLSAGAAYNTLGQSATAAFSSIYGDVSAAHDILHDISLLDLETPFQGKALTATARTLAGFGFQLEDVVSTTQALAQATAAMGLGSDALHRMAIAFGQIQSRGKLAGDEARQLANYGIDAYGLLADQLGLTVAQVRELGQAGKLTADVVIPALVQSIETRFAGATEALFNTAAGQAEGLRSVMEGVGSALVEPFIGFSTGGALVDAMSAVREELVGLLSVAEDGSFVLQGFLAPLTPIVQSLADSFVGLAESFADFLGGISDTAITDILASFEGLGPVIAALGAALTVMFVQAIPFIGRFAAGFNPIVVGLTTLALTSARVREALVDTFDRVWDAVQPLIPGIKEFVGNIYGLAEQAIPMILDVIATAFEELAPIVRSAVDAVNSLVDAFGPAFISVLDAVRDALKIVLEIIGALPPDILLVVAALFALDVLLPSVTTGLVAATSATGLAGGAAALAATQFGILATAIAAGLAALGAYRAFSAGLKGDIDYLNRDVPFYEKPFQIAGQFGYNLTGGNSIGNNLANMEAAETNRLLEEGAELGGAYAKSMEASGMSMEDFSAAARVALPTTEALGFALIAYRATLDEVMQAHIDAAHAVGATSAANMFEARVQADLGDATASTTEILDGEIDILNELKTVADNAWGAVERLSRAGADAVVDDFLVGLIDTAKDLTEALAEPAGALRDLEVGTALNAVQADALKVINVLSREYGMSLDQIESYFDERGLAGVIDALGKVTEETTETVDPLVAKYASLGATADQLRDAVARLEDQRTTALQAQIDQVEAGLRDAKDAAEEAREAVADFLSGGYIDSTQEAVDDLIGNLGSIGSEIEDGLRQGGARGEAAVRSAFGDLQGQLAAIVNAGFEEGLSGQQIVDMLGPVLQAINEEIGEGAGRISSLDWTAGITSGAGQALVDALMSGMDPAAIQGLINNILGADATVAGLESQLENLQAQMDTEVTFSAEQVQGALDEIHAETTVKAVITPEAAQLVFGAIQEVFDDDELKAAVDQAVITQGILDAAQAAEDQISLVFDSALSFNSEELDMIARQVGEEFYAAFTDQMNQLRDERAQEAGFESYLDMVSALGPSVAGAIVGGSTLNQVINNDIQVNGAQDPRATASETVAASSAAAGNGGQYDPSRWYQPVRGPR